MSNESLESALKFEINQRKAALVREMRALSEKLNLTASDLDNWQPEELYCPVNDLGEVQNSGTIIDANCGRLAGLIKAYKLCVNDSR